MAKSVPFSKKIWRTLKSVGLLGYNRKRNIFGVNPLIVSTLFIFLTLGLAAFARKLVKRFFSESESILKQLLLEFVATVELCAACFELIVVAEHWGVWTYALYLFLLTVWWGSRWEDCSACPYTPLEGLLEGGITTTIAMAVIAAQVVASLVTFPYVQLLWMLTLTETHVGLAEAQCTADLQVSVITGLLVEGIATCACRLASRTLAELAPPKVAPWADAFVGTAMVVAAFDLSGGYFNPALATGLKLGCEGHSVLEHFLVYWVGACAGALLSVLIFNSARFQTMLHREKPKTE